MKIGIVHLGDIHVESESTLERLPSEGLPEAIWPHLTETKYQILALTGDLAFSGKRVQYE